MKKFCTQMSRWKQLPYLDVTVDKCEHLTVHIYNFIQVCAAQFSSVRVIPIYATVPYREASLPCSSKINGEGEHSHYQ